jgi:transcriptional regulator with XRE-family HTH domain
MAAKKSPGPSRGSQLLSQEIKRRKLSHAQVAEKIGCTRALVTMWISGAARPIYEKMIQLRDVFGIPLEAWSQPPRKTKAMVAA